VTGDDAVPLVPRNTRHVALDLRREGRQLLVLLALARLVENDERERLDERERPELRQSQLELAGGFVLRDRRPRLEYDRARIELGDHAHDRHARLDESFANRRLNGRRATQLGEQ
jgi:hypothetical protein